MADRREQLADAFKEHVEDETTDAGASADKVADSAPEADASAAADETAHRDVPGSADSVRRADKSAKPESDPGKPVGDDGVSKNAKKADPSKGAQEDAGKAKSVEQTEKAAAEAAGDAPKIWKPAVREHWAKLPSDVRDAINVREQEIARFISQHGAAIQHKSQFDQTVQPFLPFIAAQQSTPMKAFHGLMTTAARLTTGAPQAKAQVIAEIMDTYGIDVETLDAVLSAKLTGKGPAVQVPAQSGPPEWAKPLFDMQNEIRQSKQAREQQIQAAANAELAEIEKKPFFNDLREDVGLLMQRAASRGELMTLEQAYTKARKMNSEVDKILTQREAAAKQAPNGESTVDKARRAASAVRGSPSGGAANGAVKNADKAVDRRAALTAAFDELVQD